MRHVSHIRTSHVTQTNESGSPLALLPRAVLRAYAALLGGLGPGREQLIYILKSQLIKILECQLATKFALYHHHRVDFGEMLQNFQKRRALRFWVG